MTSTIQIMRSQTATNVPSALADGELAINQTDEILFFKNTSGTIRQAPIGKLAQGLYALLASPALTGTPTAPTATGGTNTTQIATTAFVTTAVNGVSVPVTSVAGRTGAVTLAVADVSGAAPSASPTLTGTPVAPTAIGGTNTTQIATTAFVTANFTSTSQAAAAAPVQTVAGRTGAVTLAVADVSGAAPLASPALTGTPTAPTATVGTNTTQVATTAFVLANASSGAVYPITGTSAKSSAYTLGSTGGDTGKVFLLTGSFALTVPLASGGSTSAPLYYHYYKRDGSGVCTLVLSGSDTWEDGTTAAKSVYQESGTLVSVGSGIWRFAPGTRQRGWVDAGAFSATSGASAVSLTAGAGDADIRDIEVNIFNFVPSTTAALNVSVLQGGSAGTITGQSTQHFGATDNSSTISGTTFVAMPSVVTAGRAKLWINNIQSTAAYGIGIVNSGSTVGRGQVVDAALSTTGAMSSVSLAPSAGTITSMLYNVRVYRP